MVEISDRESLERWLEDRPVEDARLLAARAALRALPAASFGDEKRQKLLTSAELLALFRACATSAVASARPQGIPELTDAIREANGSSTDVAADSSIARGPIWAPCWATEAFESDAITSTVSCASNAFGHGPLSGWDAISNDAATLIKHGADALWVDRPLWPGQRMPEDLARNWQVLRHHLMITAKEERWDPWVDWYEGILEGDSGFEELELKKALIPNEIWKQGPLAVNQEIKRLTKEFFGQTIPQSEVMRYNRAAEQVEVERTPLTPDDALSNAVEKVRDDLGELRPALDGNALAALRPVAEFLTKTVTDRADLPRRVHDDFERGVRSIQKLLDDNEIAEEMEVTNLQRDLENGVIDLRAAFPEIAEMVDARINARINSLPPDELGKVQGAAEAAAEVSEPTLAEEFREDAKELAEAPEGSRGESLPEGDQKSAGYRLGGRLLKVLRIAEEVTDKPAKLVKNVGIIGAAIWAIFRLLGM